MPSRNWSVWILVLWRVGAGKPFCFLSKWPRHLVRAQIPIRCWGWHPSLLRRPWCLRKLLVLPLRMHEDPLPNRSSRGRGVGTRSKRMIPQLMYLRQRKSQSPCCRDSCLATCVYHQLSFNLVVSVLWRKTIDDSENSYHVKYAIMLWLHGNSLSPWAQRLVIMCIYFIYHLFF